MTLIQHYDTQNIMGAVLQFFTFPGSKRGNN